MSFQESLFIFFSIDLFEFKIVLFSVLHGQYLMYIGSGQSSMSAPAESSTHESICHDSSILSSDQFSIFHDLGQVHR